MIKPHQEDQAKLFFITEKVEAELIAAGYELKPTGHARAASISGLLGWQLGEMLSKALSVPLESTGTATEFEPRGQDL